MHDGNVFRGVLVAMAFTLALVLIGVLTCTALAQTCTPTTTLAKTVKLAWDAPPPLPTGLTLTGYVLERQTDTGAWTAFPAFGPTILTYTDATLQSGHTYSYRVAATAKDSAGVSASSPYAAMSTTSPPCVAVTIVTAPANLSAVPQ